MPNCGSSTLMISGNSTNCAGKGASCSNGWDSSCEGLSPRRNRGRVIEEIKDYVLMMLGAPLIDVELDEQQLDMAVKQTLKVMEYYAPREYFRYHHFQTSSGKSVYEMPAEIGYIRDVAYRDTAQLAFTADDLGGNIPLEYFNLSGSFAQGGMFNPTQPIWGHMGEWQLYKGNERTFSRLSSALGGWEYVGGYRHIKLYPIPYRAYHVTVHYMQRCNDWNEVTLAMNEGALAHAKMILGTIRKKYQGTFGPNGGISLDGDAMYQEGKQEYTQWKEDLLYKWGDMMGPTFG